MPYIVHPLRVALTLQRHQFAEPVIVAGLLHDVVEDCKVPLAALGARFGDEVAALVGCVTEHDKRLPWRARKQEALDALAAFTTDAAGLKAADALDNVRAIVADHARLGDALWQRFNAKDPADHAWYFGGVAAGVAQRLPGHALAAELADAVAALVSVSSKPSR